MEVEYACVIIYFFVEWPIYLTWLVELHIPLPVPP